MQDELQHTDHELDTPVSDSGIDKLYKTVTKGADLDIHAMIIPKSCKLSLQPFAKERVVVISQGSVVVCYNDNKTGFKAPAHVILPSDTQTDIVTLEDSICYGIGYHEQSAVTLLDKEAAEIEHFFTEGVYARKMLVPAGTQVPSHKHAYNHLSILAQGKVRVAVGPVIKEYNAPSMIEIKKDLVHTITAVTDSVWFCIHATDATDIESLEQTVILKD